MYSFTSTLQIQNSKVLPCLFTNKLVYQFTSKQPSHTCDGACKCGSIHPGNWICPSFFMAPANANEGTLLCVSENQRRAWTVKPHQQHSRCWQPPKSRCPWACPCRLNAVSSRTHRASWTHTIMCRFENRLKTKDKPLGRTGVVVQGLRMFMQTQVCLVALCM